MHPQLLIVDDEETFREDLAVLFRKRGFQCRTVGDVASAVQIARTLPAQVILCDVVMPGGGVVLLLKSLADLAELGVFVMTAFGSLESAIEAFRGGAADYLLKPLNLDEVECKIRRFLAHQGALREVRSLRRKLALSATEAARLVGKGAAITAVHELIKRVAPTDATVLITGETGTGKEVTARTIHQVSARRDQRFVAVNCPALPESLLEGELFGHVQGAFTGADRDKLGFIEAADEGTLFLDEVSEMSLATQAKLLRVLEEREVVRLGTTEPRPIDVRILASTNRDLDATVKAGKFREDLLFRLKVFEVRLPALRERREDIPSLVEHFLRKLNADLKRRIHDVDPAAMRVLMAYPWPGNVRELRNVLERAAILARADVIRAEDLVDTVSGAARRQTGGDDLSVALRAYEREHIRHVLEASGGNKEEAARRLGIDPATLYRKLQRAEGE